MTTTLNKKQIIELLPHREPMLLIDKLYNIKKLFSATAEVKVRQDKMIPDGMVFLPFCFENAPANFLTNQALDPDGKIPELKYCAAKIQKLTA